MQSTKSEILLARILNNVGLINTAPYLYSSDHNPYSTKTERILYLIELHTRGLAPLIDDLKLNREFYFDFQTTDYIDFIMPHTCTLSAILLSNNAATVEIYNVTADNMVAVDSSIQIYSVLKITTDIPTHVTLKVRLDDNS
jgi:hypothetical protein